MRRAQPLFTVLVAFVLVAGAARGQTSGAGSGVVSLSALNTPFGQDFNSLASSGVSSATPTGWYFLELPGPGGTSTANTTYRADDGSSETFNTFSFGASGSTDRALGTILGPSIAPVVGAAFQNTTGGTIGNVTISFTGEEWRLGMAGRADRLAFAYRTDTAAPADFSFLGSGTYTDFTALDFSTPNTTAAVGPLDGNQAVNQTAVSATITGLNLAAGDYLFIRWSDVNAAGADDGLAVDSFSITATPEPAAVLGLAALGLGVGAFARRRGL